MGSVLVLSMLLMDGLSKHSAIVQSPARHNASRSYFQYSQWVEA